MIDLETTSDVVVDMDLGEVDHESRGGAVDAEDISNDSPLHGAHAPIALQNLTFHGRAVENETPARLTTTNLNQHDSSAISPIATIPGQSGFDDNSAPNDTGPWAHPDLVRQNTDVDRSGEESSPNGMELLSSRMGTGLSTTADTLVETDEPSKIVDSSARTSTSLFSSSAKGKHVDRGFDPIAEYHNDYEEEEEELSLPRNRSILIPSADESPVNYPLRVHENDTYDPISDQQETGESNQRRQPESRISRISVIDPRVPSNPSSAGPQQRLSSDGRATDPASIDLEAQTPSRRPPIRCFAILSYMLKHFIIPLLPTTNRKARRVVILLTTIGNLLSFTLIPQAHTIAEAAAAVIAITAFGAFIFNGLADSPMHLRDLRRYVVPSQGHAAHED